MCLPSIMNFCVFSYQFKVMLLVFQERQAQYRFDYLERQPLHRHRWIAVLRREHPVSWSTSLRRCQLERVAALNKGRIQHWQMDAGRIAWVSGFSMANYVGSINSRHCMFGTFQKTSEVLKMCALFSEPGFLKVECLTDYILSSDFFYTFKPLYSDTTWVKKLVLTVSRGTSDDFSDYVLRKMQRHSPRYSIARFR